MNIRLIMFFALLAAGILAACSGKKEAVTEEHKEHEHAHEKESATDDEWKEMDNFHMLMAEAFHPYKDSSNLQPAKAKAAELASAAEKWVSAPLPSKVDNDDTRKKLDDLKTSTAAFAETVKKGDDKVIAEELTKVHDLFHAIQEEWYGGHEK